MALGTAATFAECLSQRRSAKSDICRVLDLDTRQSRRHGGARRHGDFSLPSVRLALGKKVFADKLFTERPLPSVYQPLSSA